jgi:hypothetical protein
MFMPSVTYILQRVEPLLCNDRKVGGYTRTPYEQRLGKQTTEQRPLLGSRLLIMQQLGYNNGRSLFAV